MHDYYYQYRNDDTQQSGLVAAADEHAAYTQITDLLTNQNLDPNAEFWEFTRIDSLLDP